jgi:hypothetical protein
MESYRLMNDSYIQRQSDLALIPPTEANPDYVRYLADIDNGAEVLPFDYVAEEQRQEQARQELIGNQEAEELIQSKIRELAVQALQSEGKIDISGKLAKTGL